MPSVTTLRKVLPLVCLSLVAPFLARSAETGLLFYLSGENGATADFSSAGKPAPTFESGITSITDGARGKALECAHTQLLAYRAPGNIYAQRGTISFFWRARDAVGPTEFPIFRVGYADHSSWDMVWLRIDYNGHGFDAFVTDANLARTRVSVTVDPFPSQKTWTHLALSWDETQGIRFYVNGKLTATQAAAARYDAALDQFGPHSRIISPTNVQSDYNFVRGGDIDELRIYDHPLTDETIVALASPDAPAPTVATAPARSLTDSHWRDEWHARFGWSHLDTPPPALDGPAIAIRKVEIHDAYDLKRWWWKACDGIRETTWPGVYNRSRLLGRNDYFQLPDWDCYSTSGKSISFVLPGEPINHLEISGSAHGTLVAQPPAGSDGPTVSLGNRPAGEERTIHQLAQPLSKQTLVFTNDEAEEPIGELTACYVAPGHAPAGSRTLAYRLSAFTTSDDSSVKSLTDYIAQRHPADERATLIALPADAKITAPTTTTSLPLVHVLVPCASDAAKITDGLDGFVLELPALNFKPTHSGLIPLNMQIKDPLWPLRNLLDFTFSVKPGEAKTLWLDTRDRILPEGKNLYLTLACASPEFGPASLAGAKLQLVFKPRAAAIAEHEIDRFTQARDCYAMITEEHTHDERLDLWNRFNGDITDLLRVSPNHIPGVYYAASFNEKLPRPPFVQPVPPAGVPLWAFRQVTALAEFKKLVLWYIDHRQIENGEFGGGISDDTDLLNFWPGAVLMGCEPEKITASAGRLLDACYANGMITHGLPTIQTDELHGYEEGLNAIGQNVILNYGSPKQLERAMETARGVATLTGVNAAGHRHFRTAYYSATKTSEDSVWAFSKSYMNLILQPGMLVADYNGNPAARSLITELADGMLAHAKKDENGRTSIPRAIHFATDKESVSSREYFPWPLFWASWKWTGDAKYLDPIVNRSTSTILSVNADAINQLDLRKKIGPELTKFQPPSRDERRAPGDFRGNNRGRNYRDSSPGHFIWQLTGDKTQLESLYADQIEQLTTLEYINTEGSIWIDRVVAPNAELQRARLGGVALLRNSTFPGHTISWKFIAPATEQSVAILVPYALPTQFKVIAYNLETKPVEATLMLWNVDPGVWEYSQGTDTNDDDKADDRNVVKTAELERSRSLTLTLPPRATSILVFKLKTPGTPYWSRPDLGIDREDVTRQGDTLHVKIHSLGSVDAPKSRLLLKNRKDTIIAETEIPAIAAPLDLLPKTSDVTLTLPANTDLTGCTVEIDPVTTTLEITWVNNTVTL